MSTCIGCGCGSEMMVDYRCVVCQERDILRLEDRLEKIRESLGKHHVALLSGSTADQIDTWRMLYRAVTAGEDDGG